MKSPRTPFALFLLMSVAGAAAFAQIAADLRGRVIDPSGASVANAHVELTESETNIHQRTMTSSTGDYVFTHLNPGSYSVKVMAAGFKTLDHTGITVVVGQTVNADLTLSPGGDQQTVEVSSDFPVMQAGTSDIQTNISRPTIAAMPLNTRNFIQLSTLAPGVALPPGTLLPRINGGRPRTNEYLYDGVSALQPEPGQVVFFPILDDIAEFTVESDNVPAEFGRFNGGVVNVATRSGSNVIHGSLFEYFRNEILNGRNYFASATVRKPEYRRNLYGATLGAPIVHDKLFFFGDYQGVKQLIGVTRISTIPTANERQGIFTGVSKIFDPTTTQVVEGKFVRQEFPNDTINIPLDPAAKALLTRFPMPSNGNAANNFSRTANDSDHQNQFDVRVDGTFRSRDRAFGRYSYYNEVELPVAPLPDGGGLISGSVLGTGGVVGLSNVLGQQGVINETHTFSARLLNNFALGYTRRGNTVAGPTLNTTASAALGIPGIPTNASFNNALPLFTMTGFQQLGPAAGTFAQFQTAVWQMVDTVNMTRGAHAIKAGLDLRWYQLNTISPPNPTGSFAFTTTGTNQQGVTNSGNSLASFLLGQVDTFSIDLQESKIRPRDMIEEYFLQDDWKVNPRLTLNLGARWTLHLPSNEKNNQGAVFNLATQQLDYLGQNGNSRSARELHDGNVAPRIGLSFLATPKMVVRSGFGIVFIDQSGITTPFTTPQFPFIQNVQQKTQDSVNAAFGLSGGPSVAPIPFTPDAGLGQSVYTAKKTAGSGYVQQWNLAVQRQITNNMSAEIAYVGSHIVHVGIPDSNLNQLTTAQLAQGSSLLAQVTNPYFGQIPASSSVGGKTVSQAQLLKPYPRFLNIATYRNNSGDTNYNALEAKVEQRFSHGVSFLFAYTHSKLIDDASSVFSSTVLSSPNTSSLVAADTFRPYLERDSSSGDMANVTSFSGTYDLPAGRGHWFASSGVGNALLGGWELNTILTLQSGMPVTVTQSTNNNSFAGFALQRPNIVGNSSLPASQRTPAHYFNTAAFATAPQFVIGTASRNPVRGPAYRDLDLALVKHTKLIEGMDMEFRAEMFNLTNTPEFSQPNGSFGSAAFGSITSTTTDPRVVQFALRLSR
ncbi:MAG: carboxypeptidase-like regulatory domain-containing protein [Edaphobacter sp.]